MSLLGRADAQARTLLPFATVAAAAMLDVLPSSSFGLGGATPFLALVAVYHWGLRRPDLLTAGSTFLIGVAHDVLTGLPPGLTPPGLLLAREFAARRATARAGFAEAWRGLALVAPLVEASRYALACLWWGRLFAPEPVVFGALLTVAVFPPAAFVLAAARPLLPGPARAA